MRAISPYKAISVGLSLAGSARLAVDYISDHCTAGVDPFKSFMIAPQSTLHMYGYRFISVW